MNTEKIWAKIDSAEQSAEMLSVVRSEKKTGFFEFLRDMFALGLKNVFYGVYDALVVLLVVSAALIVTISIQPQEYFIGISGKLYGYVFAASPAAYFAFFLLSYFKEKIENSFAVKMTCKYTVLHLSAFRMFIAGAFCLAVNAITAAVIAGKSGTGIAELVAVSFSSLFLTALVTIISLLKLGTRGVAIPAGMTVISALMCTFPEYHEFLRSIPVIAYLLLGVIALAVYQKTLINIERKYNYVIR